MGKNSIKKKKRNSLFKSGSQFTKLEWGGIIRRLA